MSSSIEVKAVDEPTPPVKPEETPQVAVEETTNTERPERPEWLPEKFKSPEDFVQAYSELESKMGSQETTEEKSDDTPKIPEPPTGLSEGVLTPFHDEYAETGELSEETFGKLEKLGFERGVVENYIEGVRAVSARETESLHKVLGGQEQFTTMANWAAENMGRDEVVALNEMFESGGEKAVLAAKSLRSTYEAANGRSPSLLDVDGVSGGGGTAYASYDAMMKEMSHPDYKTDPAFRAKVAERLKRSKNIL